MLAIPENVLAPFNEVLQQRAVQESFHVHYRKRLGYFLDFCRKYPPPETRSDQVRLFIGKLKSKKQTPQQCTQSHVISLLYGCVLRFFECISLRVQNFNFEDGILTMHGKGDKDRTVPLPQRLIPKLKTQLEVVSELHDKDLAAGFAGVFLVDSLEKKYPAAAKDFIRQWFFPQKGLTPIPGTKEHRRYHLHVSQVQEALKKAVTVQNSLSSSNRILFGTVSPHTFYRPITTYERFKQYWTTPM
ncbi:tyrosine-type recombinase/integrase [Desulfocastanea catecholica]